ncbi:MAG: hypothetical protein FWH12_02405 [Treponema sp.]|nr:hypothetical protein [Treponema sp.]
MEKDQLIPVIDGDVLHQRMANTRLSRNIGVYQGNAKDNLNMEQVASYYNQDIVVTSAAWRDSDRRARLHNSIRDLRARLEAQKNANQGLDSATISELMGAYFIDIVRLSDEMPDYTGTLTTVFNRPDMPKDINLRDFLPYTGMEREINGSNDSVPLIEEAAAEKVLISLVIKAFGHKNSLYDVVFNPFWDINRLMETAATIRIDSRNDDVIGKIVKATYDANHSQAPVTTSDTRDLRIYETVDRAIDKLYRLFHPQFIRKRIGEMNPRIYMLLNPMDRRKVQPVVSGGLVGAGGLRQMVNALPIDGIIPYAHGIQHGLPWGQVEALDFPGVKENEFYLVAVTPYGGMTFIKRDLTLETGTGSVLQLSREERAWYRIGVTFMDWLIGKTEDGVAYGGIIKGTFPE